MQSSKAFTTGLTLSAVALAMLGSPQVQAQQGYEVTEVGTLPDARMSAARGINDAGHIVAVASDLENQNIRFELLDPEDFLDLQDFEDLTPRMLRYIRNNLNNPENMGADPAEQKLATELALFYDGQVVELDGLEQDDPETGERSDSANFRVQDINASGAVTGRGTAPYERVEHTTEEGETVYFFMRERFPQAVWTDGHTYSWLPAEPDMFRGGESAAYALNNNNQVVGYASVNEHEPFQERFQICEQGFFLDDEGEQQPIADEPLEVCMWRYWQQQEERQSTRQPLFEERAYLWQLATDGTIEEQYALPLPEFPTDGEFTVEGFRSVARDINNSGDAVGTSFQQTDRGTMRVATLFRQDGEAVNLLAGQANEVSSQARLINDNGYIVGQSSILLGQFSRERLFITQTDSSPEEAYYPRGFFSDSAWEPRGINNQNQVVGIAQIESSQQSQRRRAAFLYHIDDDTVVNLNEYLPCDSPYQLVEAMDINDDGVITANARFEVDNPIGDGTIQVIRTVKLTPSDEVEPCPRTEDEGSRQGAAVHPVWLVLLSGLFFITRKRRVT